MNYFSLRFVHNFLSLVLCCPLLLSAFTGVLYQFLFLIIGVDRAKIRWLISIHQMSIFGEFFKTWYTPLVMALVIYQAVSGLYMLTASFTKVPSVRPVNNSLFTLHYNIAIFAGLPLLFMAVTGGGYRFLKNVLGYDGAKISWMLTFHKMEFLGFGYIWPAIAAVSIIALVAVGAPLNFINQMQIEIKKEEI